MNNNQTYITLTRLTKSGTPSRKRSDTMHFVTEEQVQIFLAKIAAENPGKKIEFKRGTFILRPWAAR